MRRTLTSRIILAYAIIIIIHQLFLYGRYWKSHENLIIDMKYSSDRASLETTAVSIDNLLNSCVSMSNQISYDNTIQTLLMQSSNVKNHNVSSEGIMFQLKVQKVLDSISAISSIKTYITIITPDENMYVNWMNTQKNIEEFYKRLNITDKNSKKFGITWIGLSDNYAATERSVYPYVITMLRKITVYNNSSNSDSVLIISIPEKQISDYLTLQKPDDKRYIINENGIIIVSTDESSIGKKFSEEYSIEAKDIKNNTNLIESNKNELLISSVSLNKNKWHIVNVSLYSPVIKTVNMWKMGLILFSVITLIIFLLSILMLFKNVIRPIKSISSRMKNINFDNEEICKYHKMQNEITALESCYVEMHKKIKWLMKDNIEKEKEKK